MFNIKYIILLIIIAVLSGCSYFVGKNPGVVDNLDNNLKSGMHLEVVKMLILGGIQDVKFHEVVCVSEENYSKIKNKLYNLRKPNDPFEVEYVSGLRSEGTCLTEKTYRVSFEVGTISVVCNRPTVFLDLQFDKDNVLVSYKKQEIYTCL